MIGRVLAALVLLLATSARADVVLHDGGVERDREAADLLRRRVGKAPGTVLAAEVLSGPIRAIAANLTLERCTEPNQPAPSAARLSQLQDAVLAFDIERSNREIAAIRQGFACSAEPVPPAIVAGLWFLQGASLLDQGQEEAAKGAMARVHWIEPGFVEPKGMPGPHTQLLAQARTTPRPLPARLWVWPGRVAGQVFVDGLAVAEPSSDGLDVVPGPHLIQLRLPDRLLGLWATTEGKDAILVEPASGRAIWADGGRSRGGEFAMRVLLADEFKGVEGDVHIVQFRRGRVLGSTWPAGGGPRQGWGDGEGAASVEPAPRKDPNRPSGVVPRRRASGRVPGTTPSRLRVAVGGGWAYAHPFHYGSLALDLDVLLVGPLQLSFWARPGYGGTFSYPVRAGDPPLAGPLFFAPLGAALGVVAKGDIAPYLRGAFQFAYNRDGLSAGQALLGGALQGGVDLSPKGSHFLFRAQGEVGVFGDPQTGGAILTARAWAGVGFRL